MARIPAMLALVAALAATPPPNADSLATDAARVLASERHGAVAFSLVYHYTERGPAHSVDRSAKAAVVRNDGATVATRVAEGSSAKPTLVEDDYRLPIEQNYLKEYRFSLGTSACAACSGDAVAVDFASELRDDEHGDGTMWIDGTSHHVLSLRFHPSVLPAHTDSADISVTFGQVLPDLWDVTLAEQQYDGHEFIFHGWGHVRQEQTNYRRYSSVTAAQNAATHKT